MSEPPLPRVRVVVLNWNSAWYTRRCLHALRATDYPAESLEIVLVDNGSIDGSLEQLRVSFPDLQVIENGANLGFAEGCNRGMRDRAGVDHVALVNNDTVVSPGWLRPLVDAMEHDLTVGAATVRLVLEPDFIPVEVRSTGTVHLERVEVDGIDVTGSVRVEGFRNVHALDWPLDVSHHLTGAGRLWVPAGAADPTVVVTFGGQGTATVRSGDAVGVPGPDGALTLTPGAPAVPLLNAVGTALNGLCEGFDLHLGEPDRDDLPTAEVSGFCGGGVLLRSAMLDQVGLFDPEFFAYYEDTDLSWRARRAGWRIVAVPSSVIRHAFGASAGSRAHGFYFLDRRNWMLTALRNGDPEQVSVVRGVARRSVLKAFRANIFGRARRFQRPRWELFGMWLRVLAAVATARPRLRRPRRAPVGARPTDRVRSRWQPAPTPRPPRPRPGGPLLVYLDVTDTLRSGWHAGIQRVVRALVRHLPDADADLELVPIVFSADHGRFRRVTSGEYARLLAPAPPVDLPADQVPIPPVTGRRALVGVVDRVGLGGTARGVSRRVRAGRTPDDVDALFLDRLEPGSVFLDADAGWNVAEVDRPRLLAGLSGAGVRVVPFVHDLLPVTRPEWFVAELVDAFGDAVRGQLRCADLVLTNSRATALAAEELMGTLRADPPPVCPVQLGADPAGGAERSRGAGTADDLPGDLRGHRYLLVVGTVEPRKNQVRVLDAFTRLGEEHPDLHLVVVGRTGWHAEDVAGQLRTMAADDPRVQWLQGVGDDQLDALYRHAFLVLVPSLWEGYGLPLMEAAAHGVAVITSGGGALAEVGEGLAEFADPDDTGAWARAVASHLSDGEHHRRAVERVRSARLPTWADTAGQVAALLQQHLGSVAGIGPEKKANSG